MPKLFLKNEAEPIVDFSYSNCLNRLIQDIDERSLSLSKLSDINIRSASIYGRNLHVIKQKLLDGISDPPRHVKDAMKVNKLRQYLTTGRLSHETYWEDCFKKVHWEIDGPEILDAFANDRPVEQVYSCPLYFRLSDECPSPSTSSRYSLYSCVVISSL